MFLCHRFIHISAVLAYGIVNSQQDDVPNANFHSGHHRCSVAIVILSQAQPAGVHGPLKEHLKNQIGASADWTVYFLHETWPEVGSWTIFPLFKRLLKLHASNSWFVFSDEGTIFDVAQLCHVLMRYNATKDWFLGKAIQDHEASIIHHFAFHNDPTSFQYPDVAAGFAVNYSLLKKLESRHKEYVTTFDFSIDPYHELATFVWDGGRGERLTHVQELCIDDGIGCATKFTAAEITTCGRPVEKSSVFFAVKTCKKYHGKRVPVILSTWGNDMALHLKLFSDATDDALPIVNLGLPNTEKGHCSKTIGILNYVANDTELRKHSWVVITDDDTLLSVPRLLRLLSCYTTDEPVALGERYGFRTASQQGYDYITGGGGMVFNMETVNRLVAADGPCTCPTDDDPDDMFLGVCLLHLRIPVTHASNFHQARPDDYCPDLLRHQEPVSFHKFWLIDPVSTYATWLQGSRQPHPTVDREEL